MTTLFAVSKAFTRRGPVKLGDQADLQRAIETLRAPKEERKQRRRQDVPPRVETGRVEDQAANSAPELLLEGNSVPLGSTIPSAKPDPFNAQIYGSGAEPSRGDGSTVHRDAQ